MPRPGGRERERKKSRHTSKAGLIRPFFLGSHFLKCNDNQPLIFNVFKRKSGVRNAINIWQERLRGVKSTTLKF